MRVLVIGGGPGGYVAAIRAAQLGAEVTLVEKKAIGGTCLNQGCIPTKVLLHSSHLYSEIRRANQIGIDINGNLNFNWDIVMQRKTEVINNLVKGITTLLKKNNISIIKGSAEFKNKKCVIVKKDNGSIEEVYFDNAIIATGSIPSIPRIEGCDLPGVIDSTQGLSIEKIPESMIVIGGGVIGVEFAEIFNSLGCKVAIIEIMPYILPIFDREISEVFKRILIKKGIAIYTDSIVNRIENIENGLKVNFKCDNNELYISAKKVLISTGRRPFFKGLNAESIGINIGTKGIEVNEKMQTNLDNIYAIGDCTGINMLAHVASEQGIIAAENIFGSKRSMYYDCIPSAVYTSPEVAFVGLTEEAANNNRIDYKVGRFPLIGNGKAFIVNETSGMIKIIADRKYNQILGVHVIGPRATDIIAEATLAVKMEATADEVISTIHAHPTISEALREAALNLNGNAIHI